MQLQNMKASLWNRVCQSIDCVQLLIIKSEYHEKSYLYINYFVDTRTGALIVVKSNAYDVGVIGEPIILKGTIQRHGNYYGQAQTYLSRVRVMEPCAD